MKTNTQFHRGLMALAARSATLVLALASANSASAQLNNATNGPNAAISNGPNAGASMTTGNDNSAYGFSALQSNTSGIRNTAVGSFALTRNIGGYYNTAVGYGALRANTTGYNTAVGFAALYNNTIGRFNTAFGNNSLFSNIDGAANVAIGSHALYLSKGANANTAVGTGALYSNTAYGNIALGSAAGYDLTTGDNNIDIGSTGVAGEANTTRIGDVQTRAFIAGISGVTVASGVAVRVDSNGQLGVATSSRRFKQDIASMDGASDALLALRPVTFRYKADLDPQGISQFGLIAEEVEKVAPELVVRNDQGEIYTVRYEAVNAMLLNEFLKEHRRVDAQAQTIGEQAMVIAEHEKRFASQEQIIAELAKTNAEQQKQIRAHASSLAEVAERIEKLAQRMEETKALAVRKVLHQAPASY